MNTCVHCRKEVHGNGNHPCCDIWATMAPGDPCLACETSRLRALHFQPRDSPPHHTDGVTDVSCNRCGLTRESYDRLRRRFPNDNTRGCIDCISTYPGTPTPTQEAKRP